MSKTIHFNGSIYPAIRKTPLSAENSDLSFVKAGKPKNVHHNKIAIFGSNELRQSLRSFPDK